LVGAGVVVVELEALAMELCLLTLNLAIEALDGSGFHYPFVLFIFK
jgi:hypothetical protein